MMLKFFNKKVAAPFITVIYLFTVLLNGIPFAHAQEEKVYYFLTDHLGSVDKVLDEEGNVVCDKDYLPYGNTRIENCTREDENYDFTGKEKDDETGLHYYGARYYDSNTGRFISSDPLLLRIDQMSPEERNRFLSDPQNLNAYTYAKNNPVKYVDPNGEVAILAALIVATAFVATFMSSYQNVSVPDINSPPIHTRSEAEILGSMAVAEVSGAVFGYGVGKVVQKVGQFGFKTISQLKAYRKLVVEGVDAKVAAKEVMNASSSNVAKTKSRIQEYLGKNVQKIENPDNGNITYQSQDGMKEVRFDVGNPTPHQNVHTHVVEYEQTFQGKVRIDDKKVYPSDVEAN